MFDRNDPYGVPTGMVPRDSFSGYLVASPISQHDAVKTLVSIAATIDPVTKAVDDYLLMERKARAWDELLRVTADPILIATMNAMVHPT
jgi:hypothetical protein